ncbi:MAG: ABC transporter permease [Ignavibacteriaceae bacterium]|nr:ABC transporter permease [Ignavibacteriaceae bacterium]
MNPGRLMALVEKEVKHLLRDFRFLLILLFFPVFLLMIFGYAVNFDVKHVLIGVYDQEKSQLSRELIQSLSSSSYFEITKIITSDDGVKQSLDLKEVQCVMIIPDDFSKEFYSGRQSQIQFLIDGVDGNTATIIQNYATSFTQNFESRLIDRIAKGKGFSVYKPLQVEILFWFNKDLKSSRFFIPGLIAMILIIIAVVSVSLSMVREKEMGTIEQILVSPISTMELLVGKTIPFLFIALINSTIILIAGYIFFEVSVKGSYLLLFVATLLFLFSGTGIGILVSVIADTQQVAFMMATLISLLPSLLLSGFIFPIEGMHPIIQVFTNITPAKFYINILRAIILRGVGLEAIWVNMLYLLIFSIITLLIAAKIYKKKAAKV